MDGRRWQQIQEIFARAVDLPLDEQRSAVAELSAGDESLAADVGALGKINHAHAALAQQSQ